MIMTDDIVTMEDWVKGWRQRINQGKRGVERLISEYHQVRDEAQRRKLRKIFAESGIKIVEPTASKRKYGIEWM